jgi:hypothetical protein
MDKPLGGLKQVIHRLMLRHTGIFGAAGGKPLQRFNELVDAVPVESLLAPLAPPSPIAERELPASARFIDDEKPAGLR